MKLIIGLGNPGEKYQKTRHNLGFMVVDFLAGKESWQKNKKANCLYLKKQINQESVILSKPQDFMNNSGQAAKTLTDYYKIPAQDIIVIHDDIDLALGEIKIQPNRGSAGHKGVQSIINALNTKDFTRIRIGIRPADSEIAIDTEKFVLQNFTKQEKPIIQETIKKAAQFIKTTF
ncbi:MAG: aminoacyl-tRNA hydrolase [Patescibacteria group bacterium]